MKISQYNEMKIFSINGGGITDQQFERKRKI